MALKNLIEEIKAEIENISSDHISSTKQRYGSKKDINALVKETNIQFPDELKEFWLTCDFEITLDSKIYKTLGLDVAPSYFIFSDIEKLLDDWKENSGTPLTDDFKSGDYYGFENRGYKEGIIGDMIYDKQWFPIATDSFGGSICIDMKPGPKGTVGQLLYIMFIGDGKSGPYYSGYKSLTDLLQGYLTDLKEGKFEVEDDIVYPLI